MYKPSESATNAAVDQPGVAVRSRPICDRVGEVRDSVKDESSTKSLAQCKLRKSHEEPELRTLSTNIEDLKISVEGYEIRVELGLT